MVENRKFLIRFLQPFFICFVYALLYAPVLILALFSFNDSPVSAKWVGFSLRWYKALLQNPEIFEAFRTSVVVACVSTFLSVLMGTCFVFSSKWWRSSFLFNLFYPNILLPEIALAIGVLSIFTFFQIPVGFG